VREKFTTASSLSSPDQSTSIGLRAPEPIKVNLILSSATTLKSLTAYLEQHLPLPRRSSPTFAAYWIFFRKNMQVGEGGNKFSKTLCRFKFKKICPRIRPKTTAMTYHMRQMSKRRSHKICPPLTFPTQIWNVHPKRIRDKVRQRCRRRCVSPRLPLDHGPPSAHPTEFIAQPNVSRYQTHRGELCRASWCTYL